MTREQLHQYFPDTYAFFSHVPSTHPFWDAMQHIHLDDAKGGRTLLTDLEQVLSSLHMVDGHKVLRDHLEDIETHDQLMAMLTSLYMAYLYRENKPRLVNEDHGYDLELEVADQLIAMGVVQFRNFDPLNIQFAPEIEDELEHLHTMSDEGEATTEQFFEHLQHHAGELKEHPEAKHQVMAAITNRTELSQAINIEKHIKEHPEQMREQFPHIAGVVLVDPQPGSEHAKFIPFHGDNNELEVILQKRTK